MMPDWVICVVAILAVFGVFADITAPIIDRDGRDYCGE